MYIKTNPSAIIDRNFGNRLFGDKNGENIATYFVTHNGQFHADEVFCVAAMLLAANCGDPNSAKMEYDQMANYRQMMRTPQMSDVFVLNENISNHMISFDLQGSMFDHHDAASRKPRQIPEGAEKMNGNKQPFYSSLGVLWNVIGLGDVFNIDGLPVGQENVKDIIDRDIIYPIDCVDNYGPECGVKSTFSCFISMLNNFPAWEEGCEPLETYAVNDDMNVTPQFSKAVFEAIDILATHINKAQKLIADFKYILDESEIVGRVSPNGIPYIEIPLVESEDEKPITISLASMNLTSYRILVNRNPSNRDGTFRVLSSLSDEISFGEECSRAPGLVFRHANGFLLTFDTAEHQMEFISKMVCENGVIRPGV